VSDIFVYIVSDYHGSFIPTRQMGNPQVTAHYVTYERLAEIAK